MLCKPTFHHALQKKRKKEQLYFSMKFTFQCVVWNRFSHTVLHTRFLVLSFACFSVNGFQSCLTLRTNGGPTVKRREIGACAKSLLGTSKSFSCKLTRVSSKPVVLYPGPGDPLLCTFCMSPLSNRLNSDHQLISREHQRAGRLLEMKIANTTEQSCYCHLDWKARLCDQQ